ncbi:MULTISPECIES: organomercurial transporter MerC [Pseudomonas]|uniref:Organomercurial transporter MerC n=1 Tax=Pseudomonas putida TaxID=303 RepID=A0A7Y8D311_PSEPU|nr:MULTISPECIES: organomercurial transporter MerC [Pseudomonas]MDV5388613.1 organomercurial transporter MerC [Pseudomonas juntendi]NWC82174.1 organomercurial transporter MerC [Pseudomonas putida]
MANPFNLFTRIGDKAGSVGVLVSAIGCASCFPALASLGAAIGLGFLSQWEGLFITTLLPLFAGLALVVNALGGFSHRQWRRAAAGMIGPALVLVAVFLMLAHGWRSGWLLYIGLALMFGVSIWDLVTPAHRRCGPDACPTPPNQ